MDGIIEQERLMRLAKCSQKAALRRYLRRAGIPFKELNGRILTTQNALDACLVGRDKSKQARPNLDAITPKGPG